MGKTGQSGTDLALPDRREIAVTFITWLRKQRDRSDSVGELARLAHKRRHEFPPTVTTLTTLSRYLERHGERLEHAGAVAWFEYQTKANRSANAGERSPP